MSVLVTSTADSDRRRSGTMATVPRSRPEFKTVICTNICLSNTSFTFHWFGQGVICSELLARTTRLLHGLSSKWCRACGPTILLDSSPSRWDRARSLEEAHESNNSSTNFGCTCATLVWMINRLLRIGKFSMGAVKKDQPQPTRIESQPRSSWTRNGRRMQTGQSQGWRSTRRNFFNCDGIVLVTPLPPELPIPNYGKSFGPRLDVTK